MVPGRLRCRFGCGGALSLLQAQGAEISIVIATDGALGGDPPTVNLPLIRAEESRHAAQLLNFTEPQFWKMTDRGLICDAVLIARSLDSLQSKQPDMVFIPAPTELHPDHQALSLAVVEAVRQYNKNLNVLFYEIGFPLPQPTLMVDISSVEKKKNQAMQCFVSQLQVQPYDKQITGLNCFRAYSAGPSITSVEAFVLTDSNSLADGLPSLFEWPLVYRRSAVECAALKKVIGEWEQWIAGLERAAVERDNQLTEQNIHVAELENVVAEWEPWIAGLELVIVERDTHIFNLKMQIDTIHNSKLWRMMSFPRYMIDRLQRMRKWARGLIKS